MNKDIELANRLIAQAREEWLEHNDLKNGTDIVTPYDVWFYKVRGNVESHERKREQKENKKPIFTHRKLSSLDKPPK